jgi:hypothetical protein
MDSQKRCDMACEILHATHDGDDLAPEHLKLVENWVNGFLNEKGEEAFCRLHEMVKTGYKKPWLQGVEPFTIDHVGYVYWNGHQIEHFTFRYAYSPEAKANLIELGKRCEFLESKGLAVDCTNVIWHWEKVSAGFGLT